LVHVQQQRAIQKNQTTNSSFKANIKCAKASKGPSCGSVELFTELGMPLFIPNQYFYESNPISKDEFKAYLAKRQKDKCLGKGKFKNVELRWDLGNPRLG